MHSDEKNGAAKVGPLDGWVVVLDYGKTLLGKLRDAGHNDLKLLSLDYLSPCYELTLVPIQIPQQIKQPDGSVRINIQIQTQRQISTISNFSSWRDFLLTPGALIKPVNSFSAEEQAMLAQNVKDIEIALEQQDKTARAAAMALEASSLKSFGGGARE
jgi:hypothetical protein